MDGSGGRAPRQANQRVAVRGLSWAAAPTHRRWLCHPGLCHRPWRRSCRLSPSPARGQGGGGDGSAQGSPTPRRATSCCRESYDGSPASATLTAAAASAASRRSHSRRVSASSMIPDCRAEARRGQQPQRIWRGRQRTSPRPNYPTDRLVRTDKGRPSPPVECRPIWTWLPLRRSPPRGRCRCRRGPSSSPCPAASSPCPAAACDPRPQYPSLPPSPTRPSRGPARPTSLLRGRHPHHPSRQRPCGNNNGLRAP